MQRPKGNLRRLAVGVCLLVVAGFEASTLKLSELGARLRALPRFARMSPEEARLHGSGFAFDRHYGEFLGSLREAVPESATVALRTPLSQPYLYGAAYVLAPRRVVSFAELPAADFAAVYGGRAPGSPVAAQIRFGSAGRLR